MTIVTIVPCIIVTLILEFRNLEFKNFRGIFRKWTLRSTIMVILWTLIIFIFWNEHYRVYNAFSQSSKNISEFGKEKSLFKYSVSLTHFLAAKSFLSGYNLSKLNRGSSNKPRDCCCQSNIILFVVKVEQKRKTAASSLWDGEIVYILAAVKWEKIW